MSLGTPSTGTGSNWYSEYEDDFTQLLQRLQDNTGNLIDAKDVRDMAWTLHNRVLEIGSQSVATASGVTFSSLRRTTYEVGGVPRGITLSDLTPYQLFGQMLESYREPLIDGFDAVIDEYQFGQLAPIQSLSYQITPGYSPLFSISFNGPTGLLGTVVPTGSYPEVGTQSGISPTFSSTPAVTELNIFTMSVVTGDGMTFSATSSAIYKHKVYYGPIDLTPIGGYTPSLPSSVTTTRAYITDTRIKGLTVSSLQNGFDFETHMSFGTGSYFVYAHPSVYGNLPNDGFYVGNMFSNDFTKIKDGYTFSNDFSYQVPYDIWISNSAYNSVDITIRHDG